MRPADSHAPVAVPWGGLSVDDCERNVVLERVLDLCCLALSCSRSRALLGNMGIFLGADVSLDLHGKSNLAKTMSNRKTGQTCISYVS